MRPINQRVAHIRAQKEMGSIHSHRSLNSLNHQHSGSQGLHGMSQHGTDNGSRVYSADHGGEDHPRVAAKTIIDYLEDKIRSYQPEGEGSTLVQNLNF